MDVKDYHDILQRIENPQQSLYARNILKLVCEYKRGRILAIADGLKISCLWLLGLIAAALTGWLPNQTRASNQLLIIWLLLTLTLLGWLAFKWYGYGKTQKMIKQELLFALSIDEEYRVALQHLKKQSLYLQSLIDKIIR